MSIPFSLDEVRKHLKDLGYKTITEEKLDFFIYDLTRLMKYDQKKSQRKSKGKKF